MSTPQQPGDQPPPSLPPTDGPPTLPPAGGGPTLPPSSPAPTLPPAGGGPTLPPAVPVMPAAPTAPPPPVGSGPGAPPPPPPPPPVFRYGEYDRSLASGPLAAFWIRFGAWLLDGLLYGLLVVPFAVVGAIILVAEFEDCVSFDDELICPPGQPGAGMVVLGIGVILVGVVIAAILYIRALATTGQPWGAKIVGVKVQRRDGSRVGVGRAIGRALFAGVISGQIFYLGYLWAAWDKQKQTWHDKVCDTIVVKL